MKTRNKLFKVTEKNELNGLFAFMLEENPDSIYVVPKKGETYWYATTWVDDQRVIPFDHNTSVKMEDITPEKPAFEIGEMVTIDGYLGTYCVEQITLGMAHPDRWFIKMHNGMKVHAEKVRKIKVESNFFPFCENEKLYSESLVAYLKSNVAEAINGILNNDGETYVRVTSAGTIHDITKATCIGSLKNTTILKKVGK